MSAQKCVVEGCNLEYDVVCSFSFYNVNTSAQGDVQRQEWIEGAMQEESECLWRHVSLQLCGYHFELDAQGLWIDSPMLPELLTPQEQVAPLTQTASDKKGAAAAQGGFLAIYERFIKGPLKAADIIRMEHNYSVEPVKKEPAESISRLNVRQLVDTLGYLSLKNLQRKQLWVVKVESDKAEASITQSEQVITKMPDPKQIIEIIPQSSGVQSTEGQNEVLHIMDEANIGDNFIYEIAEEQEISMEEVKEIPVTADSGGTTEWTVNIVPETVRPKYAYIKHCNGGKKKRHFTAEMEEIALQGDYENYYILPDVDPSVGVEITTSGCADEEAGFQLVSGDYEHLVLEQRPRKRLGRRRRQPRPPAAHDDWSVQYHDDHDAHDRHDHDHDHDAAADDHGDDYDDKKASARVRRKNKRYLGYDFVT